MFPNHFYYLLLDPAILKKFPGFIHKEKKGFFLRPLKLTASQKASSHGVLGQLQAHHFSVYKNWDPKDGIPGPLHYTLEFATGTARVYFDEGGNYLCYTIDPALPANASDALKEEIESSLKKLVKTHVRDIIDNLSKELIQAQSEAKKDKTTKLNDLNEMSKTEGIQSQAYKSLLNQTIDAFEKYEQLTPINTVEQDERLKLKASISEKNYLIKYREALRKSSKNKKDIQISLSEMKEENETGELRDAMPASIPELKDNKFSMDTGKLPIKDKKPLSKSHQLSVALKKEEQALYQQLGQLNTLNKMVSISRDLDNLKEKHIAILMQACIDGDIGIFIKHYGSLSGELIDGTTTLAQFLSTCNYHKHYDMFDVVYKKIKNYYITHSFASPYISYPEKTDLTALSILEYTYRNGELKFFQHLLTDLQFKPDDACILTVSLTIQACMENKNEHLAALLKAGANPSGKVQDNLNGRITYSETAFLARLEMMRKAVNTKIGTCSALSFAVINKNPEGVKLLLEHKATVDEKFSNHTDLGCTALFEACRTGQLAIVNALLEAGADPLMAHTDRVTCDSEVNVIKSTPFLAAITRQHTEVVEKMLSVIQEKNNDKLSFEELEYIYIISIRYKTLVPHSILKLYAIATYKEAAKLDDNTKNEMLENAEQLYRDALNPHYKVLGRNTSDNHIVLSNLASCLQAQGKFTEARAELKICIQIREGLYARQSSMKGYLDKANEKLLSLERIISMQDDKKVVVHTR